MRDRIRLVLFTCALALLPILLTGCRSAWVQATVINHQSTPVRLVEVDYPGGSFGVQTIAAHATYRYRFHILADDKIALSWDDAAGKHHKSTGPAMQQGESGSLRIDINPDGQVSWNPTLTRKP